MTDNSEDLANLHIQVDDSDITSVASRMQQVFDALYANTLKPIEDELIQMANVGIAGANTELERLAANAQLLANSQTSFEGLVTYLGELKIDGGVAADKFGEMGPLVQSLNAQLADSVAESQQLGQTLLPVLNALENMPDMLPEQSYITGLRQKSIQTPINTSLANNPNTTLPDLNDPEVLALMGLGGGEEAGTTTTRGTGAPRSMFGIGHALSVAGFTLGAPGLKEAGAFVYMEQGLKQALPMLEGMGATLLPMGAAIGAVAAAILIYNNSMEEQRKSVEASISTFEEFNNVAVTGTTDSIKKQIAQQEDAKRIADETLAGLKERQESALQQFYAQYRTETTEPIGPQNVDPGLLAGFKASAQYQQLNKSIEDTQKKADEAASALTANNAALGTETVKANDAALAIQKKADNDLKLAQQFAADDQMTLDAAQKRLATVQEAITTDQAHIDAMNAALSVQGQSNAQIDEETQKLKAYQQQLKNDQDEATHLTDVSLQLAKTRADETDAIKEVIKALDDEIAKNKERAKLIGSATVEEVNQLIKETQADLEINQRAMEKLKSTPQSIDDIGLYKAEWDKLDSAIKEDQKDLAFYKDTLLSVAKAHDEAAMAADTHAQQLDLFRRMLDEDAKAKAKEAADLKAADEQYAADKAKLQADQAARLAKSDAEEAEKEAQMRQDEALKEAAIGQKRSDEYLDDQAKLNQKVEDLQAAHDRKLVDIQEQYAVEDSKALLDHQAKIRDAALHLDAEAIYQENEAWRKKQQETTQQRAKEQNDLQVQLDRQIAQERKSLDDKYALEAAQDARTLAEMQARFAVELKQQQDHYAASRARQVTADGVDLADLDKAHTDKLNSIRNQYAQEAVQRQLDAWAQMQQVADTNARKLGIQVAGDAAIEAQFASFVARMMRQAENLNNMTATLTALGNEMNSRFGGLSSGSSGGSYYGGFAQGLTAFAEGTPDLGPTIRQVTTHPHESINNEDTSNLIRSQLGSNYSQSDLQNLIKGKGGVSIQNLTIPVTIGDAGGRTDDDLKRLFKATVKETFEEIANG